MSKNVPSADNQQERFLMQTQITPDYVRGLVDGEGYFTVSARIRDRKTYRAHEVKLAFGMKLSEKDSKILESLKGFLGCGYIYYCKDSRKNFCDCVEYQVKSHRDVIGKIIPFFQKYPLRFPSKKKAFNYFCKIAGMINKREHLSKKGIKKIQELSKLMH